MAFPLRARLASVTDTVAGPLSVPEQDYAVPGQYVRHSDEVPLVGVAFIEGVLDLLSDIRVLVNYKLLGVVSSVSLLCHDMFPFWRLLKLAV
jgi:hypothetical protein